MRKFTVTVKTYLELIPYVSRAISNLIREFIYGRFASYEETGGFSIKTKIETCIKHAAMVLMLDELEILTWINYLEYVNLLNLSFNANDPYAIYMEAEKTIFFMAFSIKNFLNTK